MQKKNLDEVLRGRIKGNVGEASEKNYIKETSTGNMGVPNDLKMMNPWYEEVIVHGIELTVVYKMSSSTQ